MYNLYGVSKKNYVILFENGVIFADNKVHQILFTKEAEEDARTIR